MFHAMCCADVMLGQALIVARVIRRGTPIAMTMVVVSLAITPTVGRCTQCNRLLTGGKKLRRQLNMSPNSAQAERINSARKRVG